MAQDNNFKINEDEIYTKAWNELQSNTMNTTLWSRAFSESDGDENKAKALYIKLRVANDNKIFSEKKTETKAKEEKNIQAQLTELQNVFDSLNRQGWSFQKAGDVWSVIEPQTLGGKSDRYSDYELLKFALNNASKSSEFNSLELNKIKLSNTLKLGSVSVELNNPNPQLNFSEEGFIDDDIHNSLYQAAIGKENQIYYLTVFEKFQNLSRNSRRSWNWAAFYCGGIWALYRKMYLMFFCYPLNITISIYFVKIGYPRTGLVGVFVGWIAFTVTADSIYFEYIKNKIAEAKAVSDHLDGQLTYLKYRGGVNVWVLYVFGLIFSVILIEVLVSLNYILKLR